MVWLVCRGIDYALNGEARELAALQRQQARLQRIYEFSRSRERWIGLGVYLIVSVLIFAWAVATLLGRRPSERE